MATVIPMTDLADFSRLAQLDAERRDPVVLSVHVLGFEIEDGTLGDGNRAVATCVGFDKPVARKRDAGDGRRDLRVVVVQRNAGFDQPRVERGHTMNVVGHEPRLHKIEAHFTAARVNTRIETTVNKRA